MRGTSYFWFFHCFIPSLPPISYISPRHQKPVGEKHPKKLHGHHLISCSLSDHALTEGSPKIRMEDAGTTLHSVPCLSSGVRTNNTVTSKPLHPSCLTHTTIGDEIYNTSAFEVLPVPSSPYHWQCLLATGRSSPKPGPGDSLDYLESSEQG